MELQKIIEIMEAADVRNECEYQLSLCTRDWLGERCSVGFMHEKDGSLFVRQLAINQETDESDLVEFFVSSCAAKNKLTAAIEARDKLNAEIAAMGGETLICNEVK